MVSNIRALDAPALAVAGLLGAAPSASAGLSPGSTQFPRYRELEPNVAFWGQVFTDWSSKQVAFHDVEHLDLVYSVLSIADIVEAKMPLTSKPNIPTGATARVIAMNAASSGWSWLGNWACKSGKSARAAIGGTNQITMPSR